MSKIKAMISFVPFTSKPTNEQVSKIVKHFDVRELTDNYFAKRIINGCSFRPAIIDINGNFVEQQLLAVDVDSGKSVKDSIELCKRLQLPPLLIYQTFSSTYQKQRYRIVFALPESIQDELVKDKLLRMLCEIFNGDKHCCDKSRLFFGGEVRYFFGEGERASAERITRSYEFFKRERD